MSKCVQIKEETSHSSINLEGINIYISFFSVLIFLTNFLMLIQIIQKVLCNVLMKLDTYKEFNVLIPLITLYSHTTNLLYSTTLTLIE